MNIFVLSYNQQECAQYHNNKHCVKQVLETTQILNNALCINNPTKTFPYKPTHLKHPVSLWAAESNCNFEWLLRLGYALCEEYTFRYGKTHKCLCVMFELACSEYRYSLPQKSMTPFRLCMPDAYKVSDAVQSYRNYYMGEKRGMAVWGGKREVPEWWK
jgi:hypothetical protein